MRNAALSSPRSDSNPRPPEAYHLAVPAALTAPRLTRDFLTSVLEVTGHPELIDSGRVCVSDVVANVVQHARVSSLSMDVTVDSGNGRVHVAVQDGDPARRPYLRTVGGDDERGRGLMLVRQLSAASGVSLVWDGLDVVGKSVWFELGNDRPL
ncbi:ATP-binding protein [Streptomyces sp. NPDC049577]|uniref:ATP-binding protein n=1 Tax=Streptomyces sp. NPDC049577 TaxID=3155153 RepID=UPI003424AEB8